MFSTFFLNGMAFGEPGISTAVHKLGFFKLYTGLPVLIFFISSICCMFSLIRALFEGENDFCICLKETFPQLKMRQLSRVQWCTIRRLMGKPRRYKLFDVHAIIMNTSTSFVLLVFNWNTSGFSL